MVCGVVPVARFPQEESPMPQFVVVYLGGNPPSSPEEGQKHFAEYMQWLGSLGAAAVSPRLVMSQLTTRSSSEHVQPEPS